MLLRLQCTIPENLCRKEDSKIDTNGGLQERGIVKISWVNLARRERIGDGKMKISDG